MKSKKFLGIWMDHSVAHLMELTENGIESKTIESKETLFDNNPNLHKDESKTHNKEQRHLSEYFKNIAEVILECDDIILFGPTDAKTELINILRKDHRFDKIKIEIKLADKMTVNQQYAFVRSYFRNEDE
jgi:stalled ribosome rescue protein Dom34